MYAKLINNTIRSAPKRVQHNGCTVFNPPKEVLMELGYLPVTYTQMPSDAPDGQYYASRWEQTETEIVQVWTLADLPDYTEPETDATLSDLEDAVERGLTS